MLSHFFNKKAPKCIKHIIKEVKDPSRALVFDFDKVLFDESCMKGLSKASLQKILDGIPNTDTQPIYLFLAEFLAILRHAKKTNTMIVILTARPYHEKFKDSFFSVETFLAMIREMVLEDRIAMVIYTNKDTHLKRKVMEDLHAEYFPTKSKKHLCLIEDNFDTCAENDKAGFNVIAAWGYKQFVFDFVPAALDFIQAKDIDGLELQKVSAFNPPKMPETRGKKSGR